MKVEAIVYGDRRVFTVAAFNRGLEAWLARLPDLWVEGEVTELRRRDAWASVFFTLKDPEIGAVVPVTMSRRRFDALDLSLGEGERVHVEGRAEVFVAKGTLAFRATTIERFGLGEHLAALDRLKRALAAEGLFEESRKRPLPRFPRAVGLLTGSDAAARGDILAAIAARFPPAHVVVCETRVQGRGAAESIAHGLARLAAHPNVDVVILSRGGGSLEDLLPFSDERVVRAVAACSVPVVSAVGHEQDQPLCDLAADVRAATPTAAVRLVVPSSDELQSTLGAKGGRARHGLERLLERERMRVGRQQERLRAAPLRLVERERSRIARQRERLGAAPALLVERRRAALSRLRAGLDALSPQATLERGYAVVRSGGKVLRDVSGVTGGDTVDVFLAHGRLAARVEEVHL